MIIGLRNFSGTFFLRITQSCKCILLILIFILCNQFSGNSTVIWKSVNSNRIISAGEVIIRKDHRFLLTDGYNLQIRNLKKSDAGKHCLQ